MGIVAPARLHDLWQQSRSMEDRLLHTSREPSEKGPAEEWASETSSRRVGQRGQVARTSTPDAPYDRCSVPCCVHDSVRHVHVDDQNHRVCDGHIGQWGGDWLTADGKAPGPHGWDAFIASAAVQESVSAPSDRAH